MKSEPRVAQSIDWLRVERLFFEALEREDSAREVFVRASSDDDALADEVLRLLHLHQRAESFLRPPLECHHDAQLPAAGANPAPRPGDRVGRFRLERLLGVGGMGDVWLAERADDEFHQTVAIKFIRTDGAPAGTLERFLEERQTLARLEHPAIVRLLDGGTTDSGLPYLVMECVHGVPIDRYCSEQKLDHKAIIDLFRTACDAVQYAHQNLVLHRDLKPANILVTADGRPKLLDFGIAQWLDDAREARATASWRKPLTPDYASPEQLAGLACTTASDVYSLGVILQQLCYGRLPRAASGGAITRLARRHSSETPGASNGATESQPQIDPRSEGQLDQRAVSSIDDLECIIHKALHPDPEQRYASVRGLSDDLARMLDAYPVEARRATAGYRLRRFVQRNRLLSVGIALLGLVLTVATLVSAGAWRRARIERDTARASTQFIGSILSAASPFGYTHDTLNALPTDVLIATSQRATAQLRDLPEVEFSVRMMLARTHASLWQWEHAFRESRRALQLLDRLPAIDDLQRATCLVLLGRAQTWLHDPAAIESQRTALSLRQRALDPLDPAVAEASIALGFALWRTAGPASRPEAERYYREGIDLYRRGGVSCSSDYARALYSFANFRIDGAEPDDEVFSVVREAAECLSRLPDAPDRYSVGAQQFFAQMLLHAARFDEALRELRVLERITPGELDEDPSLRRTFQQLALLEQSYGDLTAAWHTVRRSLRGECLARSRSHHRPRDWRIAAHWLQDGGSKSDLLRGIAEMTTLLGDDPATIEQDLVLATAAAASLCFDADLSGQTTAVLTQIAELHRKCFPDQKVLRATIESALCEPLIASDPAAAIKTLSPLLNRLQRGGVSLPMVEPTVRRLIRANEALGRTEHARRFHVMLVPWNAR